MHLSLFLARRLGTSSGHSRHVSQTTLDKVLETRELGANLARVWALERALRWREVVSECPASPALASLLMRNAEGLPYREGQTGI